MYIYTCVLIVCWTFCVFWSVFDVMNLPLSQAFRQSSLSYDIRFSGYTLLSQSTTHVLLQSYTLKCESTQQYMCCILRYVTYPAFFHLWTESKQPLQCLCCVRNAFVRSTFRTPNFKKIGSQWGVLKTKNEMVKVASFWNMFLSFIAELFCCLLGAYSSNKKDIVFSKYVLKLRADP
jgi:hypothetical protein